MKAAKTQWRNHGFLRNRNSAGWFARADRVMSSGLAQKHFQEFRFESRPCALPDERPNRKTTLSSLKRWGNCNILKRWGNLKQIENVEQFATESWDRTTRWLEILPVCTICTIPLCWLGTIATKGQVKSLSACEDNPLADFVHTASQTGNLVCLHLRTIRLCWLGTMATNHLKRSGKVGVHCPCLHVRSLCWLCWHLPWSASECQLQVKQVSLSCLHFLAHSEMRTTQGNIPDLGDI